MNYSDFHKNCVPYNINTTNKAKSNIFIMYILNCNIDYKMIKINKLLTN